MIQQFGFFDVDDSSQCDKAKAGLDGGTTQGQMLMMGALMCCKSKAADESVCKVDKCVFGPSKCLSLHNDFAAVEEKLTDPKAMEVDEDGELYGSCPKAILNSVEGTLCCTAGMEQMSTCVSSEVGDITSCKDTWNSAFESDFYDKAEAIKNAFVAGGYCTVASKVNRSPPLTSTGPVTSSKGTPCQDASDYNGLSKMDDGQTCNDVVKHFFPATAAECSAKVGDTSTTKAQMMAYLHGKCCKPGSQPNGVCGFISKTTPCESKAEGEFLPQVK